MRREGLGVIAVIAALAMFVCGACTKTSVQADDVQKQGEEVKAESEAQNETKKPETEWSGKAYLKKDTYINIASFNNIFPDCPTITNDASNPGDITFCIENEGGALVGAVKTAKPGESVKLDKVPAFSGAYTVLGNAAADDVYTISIESGRELTNGSWSGAANLDTDVYMNITSSNNIFSARPKVVNNANNKGNVTFRIVNEAGEPIGTPKTVEPGRSVHMDKIPAFSGTYTLQGKAAVKGMYFIAKD